VIEGGTHQVVATVPAGDGPFALGHNPVAGLVFCANNTANTVTLIDIEADTAVGTAHVGTWPTALVCSPTANLVYCANREDGTVSAIRPNGSIAATIRVGAEPEALAWSARGNRLYVANRGTYSVSAIDCGVNEVRASISTGDEPVALAWDNDEARLYVANHASSEITVVRDTTLAAMAETVGTGVLPVYGSVFAGTTLRVRGKSAANLFDETGALVRGLAPGDNDIRAIAPGVYFIVPTESSAGPSRKLLIAR
jgi:YVTN family beta-propeller protein